MQKETPTETDEIVVVPDAKQASTPPTSPPRLTRPARALVGWMRPEEANLVLTGRRMDQEPSAEQAEHAERARQAVSARAAVGEDSEAVTPCPRELGAYVTELQENPVVAKYFAEG